MGDTASDTRHAVVLFDGVCNFCNGTVLFFIDRNGRDDLRFAALQSEAGARVLRAHGRDAPQGDPDSILLVEDGAVYERSDAALRIARHLDGIWRFGYWLTVVPRVLRDAVYRFIARNRYRWFGRSDACRIPTPALRARFLS